ncbi:MAG TPA: hypothetical protein VJU61_27610 [Polyangiaceae bacterium]|nr:hypothetical protein [Polyangiaceae bacterium]
MRNAIFLVGWALSLGCSDDGDGKTTSERDANRGDATGCAAFCARSVGCANDPAADCVRSCQQSSRLCPAESAAAMACARAQPDSNFHCDSELQITAVNEDVCSSETDDLLECVIEAAL